MMFPNPINDPKTAPRHRREVHNHAVCAPLKVAYTAVWSFVEHNGTALRWEPLKLDPAICECSDP